MSGYVRHLGFSRDMRGIFEERLGIFAAAFVSTEPKWPTELPIMTVDI